MKVDRTTVKTTNHRNGAEDSSEVFQGVHRSLDGEPQHSTKEARALRIFKLGIGAAAGASFVASVSLWFLTSREHGLFVGLWVPSILSLGAFLLAGDRGGRSSHYGGRS